MPYFYIATQTLENYGAHTSDGRFRSNNHYWKLKGGQDYIISGVEREQDAVAFVAALCENNIYYKEFPSHWYTVDKDFQTANEKLQVDYEGVISYPAIRINVSEYIRTEP